MPVMHRLVLSAFSKEPVDVAQYEGMEPLSVFKHNVMLYNIYCNPVPETAA